MNINRISKIYNRASQREKTIPSFRTLTSKGSQFSKMKSETVQESSSSSSDNDIDNLPQSPKEEPIYIKPKELNIIYILYKALLDVVSYNFSIEDIIKNGYNFTELKIENSFILSKRKLLKEDSREMTHEELLQMEDEIKQLECDEHENLT